MTTNDDHVKNRTRIDFTYIVTLTGAMSINSGFPRGMVDRTVVRGLDALPYLPASTLKGRVRDMAERLSQSLDIPICHAPNPEAMCPAKNGINGDRCIVCRTFGAPGVSSKSGQTGLVWRDARLSEENGKPLSKDMTQSPHNLFYERTQVQLSRPSGVALAKHLFTSENTLERLNFKGRIRGWMDSKLVRENNIPENLVLLCAALKLLSYVGSGKSRGLGRCKVDFLGQIEIGDDKKYDPKEVLQHVDKLG
ncbi:MAG: RAMP superfamily CRISPR-associated protein [bacterium]